MSLQNVVVAGGGVLGSQIAYQCAYKEKIDAGKTGVNAGEGFYKYN